MMMIMMMMMIITITTIIIIIIIIHFNWCLLMYRHNSTSVRYKASTKTQTQ